MLKVEFKKFGVPEEQIYLKEVGVKNKLNSQEVLLQVLFFPINPADLLLVQGKYSSKLPLLPSSVGAECVAKVLKVSDDVKKLKVNDIVIPLTRGTWAENLIVKENEVIKIQKKINLCQASMLKVNPASAYLMLNNYVDLKKNDIVLQNAANSGVGNYIIQLSKYYKLKTINLVRRKELIVDLKKIGATNIIVEDHKKILADQPKVKLFIDAIGGSKLDKWASCLKDHGTIINYGLLAKENIQIDMQKVIFNNISIKGFWLSLWLQKMTYNEKLNLYNHLAELIFKKVLYTKVEKIYHISQINMAVKRTAKFKRKGKILVGFDKYLIKKYADTTT